MDARLAALAGDPRFYVTDGEVRALLLVENADGQRSWIEGKPDRLVFNMESGSVHLCECKGGLSSSYTPNQRVYYGGTIVDMVVLDSLEIRGQQIGGARMVTELGLRIGQSGLFAESGGRVINSSISRGQFMREGMKLFNIRGIRAGGGSPP